MSQTTEIQIQNQNGLSFRTKLNQMLSALNTVFAGTTAPTVTEANMLWMDTSVSPNILKRRNSSDTAWEVCPIVEGEIHAATGKPTPSNNDEFAIVDSASGNILKKILWSEIKTELLKGGNLTGPFNANSGGTLASASTVNIGAATGEYITISGTTTITAFDVVQAGTMREVRFSGALTLTHNATSLILPSNTNITTATGDCATFRSEGSGNWRCVKYQRADGTAIVGATLFSNTAENQAGVVSNKAVSPLGIREAFNASGSAPVYACRAWCRFNGSGTVALLASGNVSSITDNGTGDYTVNFTTAMPDANYAAIITDNSSASNVHISPFVSSANLATYILAGSMRFSTYAVTGSIQDSANVYFSAYR